MTKVALIGFGEAGQAFAGAPGWRATVTRAFDLKGAALAEAYRVAGVVGDADCATALRDAELVLSVVPADQALGAARAAAPHVRAGALYADMNSVAPGAKAQAAAVIEASGGRYLDVAVMAPVHPARLATPLLVGGSQAEPGAEALRAVGFSKVSVLEGPVGAASAIKLIRSVMVKGLEALSAECALAAQAAGVLPQVVASLDASWPGADWAARFDYNLDRMLEHGLRRAAEMDEAVDTLEVLGVEAVMSRGTAARQRTVGALAAKPPKGLAAKLALIAGAREARAA